MRDTAVNTPIELEDEDLLITFVPHNEALNRCTTTFGPAIWLMYFGSPYDYYINKSLGGDTSPSCLLFQTLLPLFWTLTCMI